MKLLGHPLHQQWMVFPLGLLGTAVVFDIIALVGGNHYWFEIAFWPTAAGVIGGLAAAIFGLTDWTGLPANTRAKRIGLWYGGGNLVALILFVASWRLRNPDPTETGPTLALSFIGVAIALVSGWLGGEHLGSLGVSADEGANLNAPSSLSAWPKAPAERLA